MKWEPMGVALDSGRNHRPDGDFRGLVWRFSRDGDGARVRMVAVTLFEDGAPAGSVSRCASS